MGHMWMKDVFVDFCPACLEAKMANKSHKSKREEKHIVATKPFHLVNADYKGPYPESLPNKERWLLNFRCDTSAWVTSYTTKTKDQCGNKLRDYCGITGNESNPTNKPPK